MDEKIDPELADDLDVQETELEVIELPEYNPSDFELPDDFEYEDEDEEEEGEENGSEE